ncbi:HNH endonuclease signature motif containing protein [Microvirga sp. GCM10011540]|uniref:HNH endonuclease signature motif containing protein n=1 Tax=Microvirga sp. GCM10011540 TaxID=3317338 RepID=UPI0036210422
MNRKQFSKRDLTKRLAEFGGKCRMCGCTIDAATGLEWDHRIPLAIGGEDTLDNLEPLCIRDHRLKTKGDVARIAKATRQHQRNIGIRQRKGPPMVGSKDSPWKRRMDGTLVRRSK